MVNGQLVKLAYHENRAHGTHGRHRKIIGTGGASSLPSFFRYCIFLFFSI